VPKTVISCPNCGKVELERFDYSAVAFELCPTCARVKNPKAFLTEDICCMFSALDNALAESESFFAPTSRSRSLINPDTLWDFAYAIDLKRFIPISKETRCFAFKLTSRKADEDSDDFRDRAYAEMVERAEEVRAAFVAAELKEISK
jgi:hypothetical protein